jgi:membrane protease YdiL (CAAX protease family)
MAATKKKTAILFLLTCGAILRFHDTQAFRISSSIRGRSVGAAFSDTFRGRPSQRSSSQRRRPLTNGGISAGGFGYQYTNCKLNTVVADVYDDHDKKKQLGSKNKKKLSTSRFGAPFRWIHTLTDAAFTKLFRLMHWTTSLPPGLQFVVAILLYTFHLTILTQHAVVFPVQLIPVQLLSLSSLGVNVNVDQGLGVGLAASTGTGVGWDSLVGMGTLGLYAIYKRRQEKEQQQQQPPVSSSSSSDNNNNNRFPWQLPANSNRHKLSFLVTTVMLTQAYFFTGQFSLFWEDLLYSLSAQGWPLTAPMHRSLCVLLGHASWVVAGSAILWLVPRPPPFFGKLLIQPKQDKKVQQPKQQENQTTTTATDDDAPTPTPETVVSTSSSSSTAVESGANKVPNNIEMILWLMRMPRPPPFIGKLFKKQQKQQDPKVQQQPKQQENKATTTDDASIPTIPTPTPAPAPETGVCTTCGSTVVESGANNNNNNMYYSWFRSQWKAKWLWWAIGGYFVSSWLFNVADLVNQWALPAQVLLEAQESVVSQLVNPEHNDVIASVVGYIAPCLTAPVWEEVLYRGFALAGLTVWTGRFHVAAVIQAVIFSAHHMSVTAALPLFVLGWTWAMLYKESRNLFTVIFVHALWNSRVFLGSWLGL